MYKWLRACRHGAWRGFDEKEGSERINQIKALRPVRWLSGDAELAATRVMASAGPGPRVWQVGALCRALADALDARFNPVTVLGEITGFSRASSGHCYFALKDPNGQLRCVMFKRASSLLAFTPADGGLVEVSGRLAVYEPRGDLQLVVESMRQAGAGALFERFLQVKAKLQGLGLFDQERKRALPMIPRGIGLVTSLGAAALHDVVSALKRRAPHVPVLISAAAVQGASAPSELVAALRSLYAYAAPHHGDGIQLDTILLVRGGGSMEDLWAFNDEALARAIAESPVPVISGVGHETDFTIADWVADVRAPTPTAAAELAAQAVADLRGLVQVFRSRLDSVVWRAMDTQTQRIDRAAARLGRPSALAAAQRQLQLAQGRRLRLAVELALRRPRQSLLERTQRVPQLAQAALKRIGERQLRAQARLKLLDPALVLQRGYAWLQDESGRTVCVAASARAGQLLKATLADGQLDLTVQPPG